MSSRVKSLLTPFYKLAHPDVLRQAPENVQKMNSLALSVLNSYIDSVVQGEKVGLSSLRFYVPCGKNFSECKVTLLPLKSQVTTNIRDLHLESVVNSITQAISTPEETLENQEFELPPRRIRMRDEFYLDTTTQIRKHFAYDLKYNSAKTLFKNISSKIEREYNPSHPSAFGLSSRKSNFFIEQALESASSSAFFKNFEKNQFPIEKLFFDEILNNEQVVKSLEILTGRGLTNDGFFELHGIRNELRDTDIGLVISTRYSARNVPGCLQVPFDCNLKDINHFIFEQSAVAQETFSDYSNFAYKTNKAMRQLTEIIMPCTLARYMYKNQEKYEKQTFAESYTAVKKLLKIIEFESFPKGLKDSVLIFGFEYKFENGFIQIPCNFTGPELVSWLTSHKNK